MRVLFVFKIGVKRLIFSIEGIDEDEEFSLDGDGALHFDFGGLKDAVVEVFEFGDVFDGDQSREVQASPEVVVSLF